MDIGAIMLTGGVTALIGVGAGVIRKTIQNGEAVVRLEVKLDDRFDLLDTKLDIMCAAVKANRRPVKPKRK